MATFLGATVLAGLRWMEAVSAWWLLLPLGVYVGLVLFHDRVIRAQDATARAIAFYEHGLSRLDDRWIGTGESGERFRDDSHLYANDLDLFGRGSLFELLSLARTLAGEETLARWLKQPALGDEIAARQEAVRELTFGLDLREDISLAGARVRAGVDPAALAAWTRGATWTQPSWWRAAAFAVTGLTLAMTLVVSVSGVAAPLLAALVAQLLFTIARGRRVRETLRGADAAARDLEVLAVILRRLERERFKTPRLLSLRRQLDTRGTPASTVIRRLRRLVDMADWSRNTVFAPVGAFLLWHTHLAGAIDAWRRRHGTQVHQWVRAVGEFEALASLSAYRYENPDAPFPDHLSAATAILDAKDLRHPLIPRDQVVRNDVAFSDRIRLLIVSGSNMSGKSTLLRTVGINVVLGLAGAPVRATSLRLSSLAVGATLRIQDSLSEGRSRFYAEITRIRGIADLANGPVPVLFLFDELLHGTNSHDRLVGASGVLENLLDRGAIGLVTTHDLALVDLTDRFKSSLATPEATSGRAESRAANVHFDDHFEDGELRFDYRMKPGPVTRSNAIALMQAVGLDVVGDDPHSVQEETASAGKAS